MRNLAFLLILLLHLNTIIAINVELITLSNKLPEPLIPYNNGTVKRITLFDILQEFDYNNKTPSMTTCEKASDRVFKQISSNNDYITVHDLYSYINESMKTSYGSVNTTDLQVPSNSTVQLASEMLMHSISPTDKQINKTELFEYYQVEFEREYEYYPSVCQPVIDRLRQCKRYQPMRYFRNRQNIQMLNQACLSGITALGGWRLETCVIMSFNTDNSGNTSWSSCKEAIRCFKPTPQRDNNTNTDNTESTYNSNITGLVLEQQLIAYLNNNITQVQQAQVIGQRVVFGAFIEEYYGIQSKRNYWIYYGLYTAIGSFLFIIFALMFPVLSLMLGVGGIVANIIFLVGNHYLLSSYLGSDQVQVQSAIHSQSPNMFAI